MLGHSAQSVGGALPGAASVLQTFGFPEVTQYIGDLASNNIQNTWTAPADGEVEFVAMSAGGRGGVSSDGGSGGASGSLAIKKFLVSRDNRFSFNMGFPSNTASSGGADLVLTLPDGSTLTLGNGGNGVAAPVGVSTAGGQPRPSSSGWDFLIAGSRGGAAGAAANSSGPGASGANNGGAGGSGQNRFAGGGGAPGGGGYILTTIGAGSVGASNQVIGGDYGGGAGATNASNGSRGGRSWAAVIFRRTA